MPKKMTAEDWNDSRVMLTVDPVMKEDIKKRMAKYGGTPQSWLLEGYRRHFMEGPQMIPPPAEFFRNYQNRSDDTNHKSGSDSNPE